MIGLAAMIAAAAQGPVMLARNDEAQWRMFVRASYETPQPEQRRQTPRMRQLEQSLHGITDRARTAPSIKGPLGL